MASPSKKTGPNSVFNGLVADCEGLTQDAYGVSHRVSLCTGISGSVECRGALRKLPVYEDPPRAPARVEQQDCVEVIAT